jgi:hypothetical protein
VGYQRSSSRRLECATALFVKLRPSLLIMLMIPFPARNIRTRLSGNKSAPGIPPMVIRTPFSRVNTRPSWLTALIIPSLFLRAGFGIRSVDHHPASLRQIQQRSAPVPQSQLLKSGLWSPNSFFGRTGNFTLQAVGELQARPLTSETAGDKSFLGIIEILLCPVY